MRNVTIEKGRLKETVLSNREKHEAEYQTALAGWKVKVLAALQEAPATFLRTGSLSELNFQYAYPEPTSHLNDYDMALQMIDWEAGSIITLDESTFRNLVLDKWEWSGMFRASSNRYSAH